MPNASTKTRNQSRAKGARSRRVANKVRRSSPRSRSGRNHDKINDRALVQQAEHDYVIRNGKPAYVLVPIDEYEELIKASMVQDAITQIETANDEDFVDAADFALELAAERIASARKAKGLTQKQLGDKLGLPQSQISRIERNPDHTTVRTLKRIARALGVDVRALINYATH